MNIINHGTIDGTFFVNPMVEFSIRNDSVINAIFNLSPNSTLKQYVSSPSEITKLNVSGSGYYIPTICDGFVGSINARDLIDTFDRPVSVKESGLTIFTNMDDIDDVLSILDIDSNNASVILQITDYDGRNLSFDNHAGLVQFAFGDDGDVMFNYNVTTNGAFKIRETNYTAILGQNDKRAVFLNNLRILDPSNKILHELDAADTPEELLAVMNKTMFFNPLVINDGIIDIMTGDYFNDTNMGFYISASPKISGDSAGSSFSVGNDIFSTNLYIGSIKMDDEYKYGSANVYSAGIGARYGWFKIGAKIATANWKDTMIMTDNGIETDPKSRLFYEFLDFSPKTKYFQPLVRFNHITSSVGDKKDNMVFVSYGGQFYFTENINDNHNKYGVYAVSSRDKIDYGLSLESVLSEDNMRFGVRLSPNNLSIEMAIGF
jgi:hypothetical protein